LTATVLAAALVIGAAASERPSNLGERKLPVTVRVIPRKAVFRMGEPVFCDVTISNGLAWDIRFSTYSLAPTDWNAETTSITLVDIYREPGPVSRPFDWRPHVNAPLNISGMASYPIKPGASLSILIDLRKWLLIGGWVAGKYRVDLRVDGVALDSYSAVTLISDPVELRIE
jgi:hypothetical protein